MGLDNRAPLAGDQVTTNTLNTGGALTTVAMILGIAHEYGLTVPLDQRVIDFATDPRVVMASTSAVLWAANTYRKSRLHRIIDSQLERLEHEEPRE